MAADPLIEVRRYFFDRKSVMDKLSVGRRRALSRLGSFIMTTARRSMKRAPPTPTPGQKIRKNARALYSPPGKPPYKRIGFLHDFLFFVYDPIRNSVVIGPTPRRKAVVPGLMEVGGVVRRIGRRITYLPRPYMQPAYEQEIEEFPRELKDLI